MISRGLLILILSSGVASRLPGAEPVTLFPGSSRAISRTLTASRDAALPGYQFLPQQVQTGGIDFGIVQVEFGGGALRLGFLGFVELEAEAMDVPAFFNERQHADFWRGHYGYSLAYSSAILGRRVLGNGGRLEAALSIRHESDHSTGNDPSYALHPNIGDFVMPELAARLRHGRLQTDLRIQHKLFLSRWSERNYQYAPGADLIVRWFAASRVHPFAASFLEYMRGAHGQLAGFPARIPDARFYRQLVGIVLPGRAADVQLFTALGVGHGKGNLVYEERVEWGWGLRVDVFGPADRN